MFSCCHVEEIARNVLLHYSVASSLWDIFFPLVSIQWVFPSSVKEALISWRGLVMSKEKKKLEISSVVHLLVYLEGEKLYNV